MFPLILNSTSIKSLKATLMATPIKIQPSRPPFSQTVQVLNSRSQFQGPYKNPYGAHILDPNGSEPSQLFAGRQCFHKKPESNPEGTLNPKPA